MWLQYYHWGCTNFLLLSLCFERHWAYTNILALLLKFVNAEKIDKMDVNWK